MFEGLKQPMCHVYSVAVGRAGGSARQFPDRFPGDPMAPSASLRSAVNQLFQEHTLLAGNMSGAYLGGRALEFQSVAAIQAQNGLELSAVIDQAYGPEAQAHFAQAWAIHLAQMTAYTDAVQNGDQVAQRQAMADMTAWIQNTTAWFGTANEMLSSDQLANGLSAYGQALAPP